MAKTLSPLPLPVKRALRKLGSDIRDARRRRRIPTVVLAERALISRGTLSRVERGEPTVSMGVYATVLYVLGLVEYLERLADPRRDDVGLALEEERLPKRVARKRARGTGARLPTPGPAEP